jgi:hypothetical protein
MARGCGSNSVGAVISGMAKLSFVLELVEREPTCPFNPDVAA